MSHLSNEGYSIWLSELKRKPKNPERVTHPPTMDL